MRKWTSFFATALIVLTVCGSQFLSTVFAVVFPLETVSRLITIPYRAFTLLISLTLIALTLKNRFTFERGPIIVLWLYWFLILCRFCFDIYIRQDVSVSSERVSQLWLYMICMAIIPAIAIVRSYRYINVETALTWAYALTFFACILMLQNVEAFIDDSNEDRISGGLAMGSIATGYFGLLLSILSITQFKRKKSPLYRCVTIVSALLGLFIMVRAGSRGPVLSLMIITIFYFISTKMSIGVSILVPFALLLVVLFWDSLLNVFYQLSPVLYERLNRDEGQLSDRLPIWEYALNEFAQNPFIGHSFGVYGRGLGGIGVAHNVFIESLMQLGLVGFAFLSFLIVKSLSIVGRFIRHNSVYSWLGIFWLMRLMLIMVSSSFTLEYPVTIMMAFLFVANNTEKTVAGVQGPTIID